VLLAIDVGNTNTVLGLFEDDSPEMTRSWRIKTDARATADEMWLTYRGLLRDQPELNAIVVCSTVPMVLRELRTMLSTYMSDKPAVVVEPGVKTGVPVLTDNPKEVGADRVVNTLAAHHLFGGPAIVVDFGTSTNLDVVSAPGIEISVDALAARAAQLRKVELVRPRSVVGKNTVEALQSGILYGFAGQVDGLVDRIAEDLDEKPVVVATGGLAPLIVAESRTIDHHRPDLTLVGLRLVYERNQ
jgi:type III pantothenate kinase